jgi:hypothetical protein
VPQRCHLGRRDRPLGDIGRDAGLHGCPVDVIDIRGQTGHHAALRRDAEQPAAQQVRIWQLRGISDGQAGDNEGFSGGGDRRVRIRPQEFGAETQQRAAMLADHALKQRRSFPLRLGLPEPAH